MDNNDKKNGKRNQTEKNAEIYICELCDFKCTKKSNYEKHKLTAKHRRHFFCEKKCRSINIEFICECGRKYMYESGLSRHRKKCNFVLDLNLSSQNNENIVKNSDFFKKNNENIIISKPDDISKDLIVKVLQENTDIKEILIKQFETMQNQQKALEDQHLQLKELIPKVGNNNTITNVKQKFNINIFLNEQCKDALNLEDFIKQINISLENLDTTKSKGLTEGLSNLLIENINKLSVYQRPVHCTDTKRETLYIKENDVWEKDRDKTRIKSAIKDLTKIQYKNIKQWIDANPDYMDDPDKQEYFIDLVRRCSSDLDEVDNKVIKKVCNNVNIKDDINNDIIDE